MGENRSNLINTCPTATTTNVTFTGLRSNELT